MQRTDTTTELHRFVDVLGPTARGGRRRWAVSGAVAMAVAVAAVAIGFTLWPAGTGDDRGDGSASDPVSSQSADEEVAQGFVDAYTAGDADQAASYLAPGVQPWDGWRFDVRRDAAWGREYFVQPCRAVSSSSEGTTVGCAFAYHVLHSRELGLGPFTDNAFEVVVADGKVARVSVSYSFSDNGQSQLYEAMGSWISEEHPGDWARMNSQEGVAPADRSRWLSLWKRYSREYADAATQ